MEYIKVAMVGALLLFIKSALESRKSIHRRERVLILVVVAVVLSAAFHVAGF